MAYRLKVLIVEDEPLLYEAMAYHLEKAGFEVLAAFDGASGLEQARIYRPDVVLLDVMLPELSGLEVCHSLRGEPQYAPEQGRQTILLMSARAEDADRAAGLAAGADAYWVKPFAMRDLVAFVQAQC